jgi:AraC family transcriptional activator of tynA and feaB
MFESSDFTGTPELDYEAWRAWQRSYYGDPGIGEAQAFAGWMRPLSVCGVAATAIKVQCCNAYHIKRTHRDIRRDGLDCYRAIFPVAGRSLLIQNDQAMEFARGDIALVDMARPATFSANRSGQRLTLSLPRQPLITHLGFEPQGGFCGRSGTLATRLLRRLIRDAIEDEASLSGPARSYMQMAVYDLLGAVFAPSDPFTRHNTDKLFARICGIIRDRFADPDFGPSEVATESGVSLRYLQKLFTARGSTCISYIQSLRLDRAARLLQRRATLDLGHPLIEIAYACGFNDYSYFVRKFRRRFGHPPSAHAGVQGPRGVLRP